MSDETNSAVIEATPATVTDATTESTPAETAVTEGGGSAASVADGATKAVEGSTVDDGSASVADVPQEEANPPADEAGVATVEGNEVESNDEASPAEPAPPVLEAEAAGEASAGQTETAPEGVAGEQAVAGSDEAATPAQETTASDENESEEENRPVVRLLSVGQEVQGVVKRISEFGAFVDIGVGRDGLVHISELSPRRIAKVTDVLQEGQEATFWIKKLDRERNRISLTMIEPGTKTIRNMDKGDIVEGKVTRIMPYGAFVDIGIGRDALLHVREMGERYIAKPEDVVQVGETIEARIIDISRRRARVDLSVKGLRPEPESEPQPAHEQQQAGPPAAAEEPEVVDNFADAEVLSPFAAALRRAEEASGVRVGSNKSNKKKKRQRNRGMDEEIFERTLNSGGKQ